MIPHATMLPDGWLIVIALGRVEPAAQSCSRLAVLVVTVLSLCLDTRPSTGRSCLSCLQQLPVFCGCQRNLPLVSAGCIVSAELCALCTQLLTRLTNSTSTLSCVLLAQVQSRCAVRWRCMPMCWRRHTGKLSWRWLLSPLMPVRPRVCGTSYRRKERPSTPPG